MLTLFSPCKINLFFHVLQKRSDGYHTIETDIALLDRGDTLSFSLHSNTDKLSSCGLNVPLDASNLIIQAITLFRLHYKKPFFVQVHLNKKIPLEAGLGGGSSNAATTLYALNKLLDHPFQEHQLIDMAAILGADVSCFFSLGRALCYEKGEKITLKPYETFEVWIVKPRFISLPTKNVFQELMQEDFALLTNNHLETPAFRLSPDLKKVKEELIEKSGGLVHMTGSGSAFVCYQKPCGLSAAIYEVFSAKTIRREPFSWYQ